MSNSDSTKTCEHGPGAPVGQVIALVMSENQNNYYEHQSLYDFCVNLHVILLISVDIHAKLMTMHALVLITMDMYSYAFSSLYPGLPGLFVVHTAGVP